MPRKKIEIQEETQEEVKVETPIKAHKSITELQEIANNHPYKWSNDFIITQVGEIYCVSKGGQLIMWSQDKKKCDKIAKTFNLSERKAQGNVRRSDMQI